MAVWEWVSEQILCACVPLSQIKLQPLLPSGILMDQRISAPLHGGQVFGLPAKNLSQMEEPRSPVGSTPFKNKNWGLLISSMSTKARPNSFNNASKRSTVEKTSFSSTPNFRHAWNFSAHKLVRNVIFMLDTPILGNPWESCWVIWSTASCPAPAWMKAVTFSCNTA